MCIVHRSAVYVYWDWQSDVSCFISDPQEDDFVLQIRRRVTMNHNSATHLKLWPMTSCLWPMNHASLMLNTTTLTINSKVIVIVEVLDLSDPSIIVTHLTHCPMTRRPEPILLCCILDRNMLNIFILRCPCGWRGSLWHTHCQFGSQATCWQTYSFYHRHVKLHVVH